MFHYKIILALNVLTVAVYAQIFPTNKLCIELDGPGQVVCGKALPRYSTDDLHEQMKMKSAMPAFIRSSDNVIDPNMNADVEPLMIGRNIISAPILPTYMRAASPGHMEQPCHHHRYPSYNSYGYPPFRPHYGYPNMNSYPQQFPGSNFGFNGAFFGKKSAEELSTAVDEGDAAMDTNAVKNAEQDYEKLYKDAMKQLEEKTTELDKLKKE